MSRQVVVVALAAFLLAILLLLTVVAVISTGLNVLTLLSLVVFGVLFVGVAGAIFNRSGD